MCGSVELINMCIQQLLTLPCELYICRWHLTQDAINPSEATRLTLGHTSAVVFKVRLSRVSMDPYMKSNTWNENTTEVDSIFKAFSFIEIFILFDV